MGHLEDRRPVSPERTPSGYFKPGRLLRRALRAPARLYDWHLGWLLGHRFLRLTHRGRRSGRRYRTVLEVVGRDRHSGEYLVMAGFGPKSEWYRNLQANPHAVQIDIGGERFVPQHRLLTQDEALVMLEAYERRNRIVAPIIRRVLAGLIGQPYDGSDTARHTVVRALPMIAFRPGPAA